MHNHSEAFCLMLYRCLNEECGQAEAILETPGQPDILVAS